MRPLRSAAILIPVLLVSSAPSLLAASFSVTTLWQDNATNADRDTDVLDALTLSTEAATTRPVLQRRRQSLVVGARATADIWPRYDELNRATFGATASWRHKPGLGPHAPLFLVALSADALASRDSARRGLSGALAFTYRQRFGDATTLSLAHEFSRLDARSAVFDRTGSETSVTVARLLNDSCQLAVTGRYRRGTVLSYATPPRPELVALARARVNVDTFDRPMVAYSLDDARTAAVVLALTRTLGQRTSLTAAVEYRDTDKATLRYLNHVLTLSLAHDF